MLHIVNKSPESGSALHDCLRLCRSSDVLLLIGDGVYAALSGAWLQRSLGAAKAVYVLTPDLDARGVGARRDPRVVPVDYAGFVQLCCDHTPIQSWF